MINRKKKSQTAHQQKVERAHHRNEFLQDLKTFCDNACHPTIFKLIPEADLQSIYNLRMQPIRVTANKDIPTDLLQFSKYTISQLTKTNYITVNLGSYDKLSLYDYYRIAINLALYAERLKTDAHPNAITVKNALQPLLILSSDTCFQEAWFGIDRIVNTLNVMTADIEKTFYAYHLSMLTSYKDKVGIFIFINIVSLQTDKIQVRIDGHNRLAYQVACPIVDTTAYLLHPIVKGEAIGMPEKQTYKVYIQVHAINRLNERLDGVLMGSLYYSLYDSTTKLIVCKNKKGELLFEYRLFNVKVGYLVAEIINDNIVIRTFLFLTNNGTPEGEKLHSNRGIMKADKMYLEIDKLSTFINSDITSTPALKQLFIDAGCQSLFTVDIGVIYDQNATKEKTIGNSIAHYLKLDEAENSL